MEFQAEQKVLKAFKRIDFNGDGVIETNELTQVLKELDPSFTPTDISRIMRAADFNKDGQVKYEEFVGWIFGVAGGGLKDVGSEAFLQRLLSVEGDQQTQDDLFQKLQSQGACMIATVSVVEPDNLRMLTILKCMRALFAMTIWNDEVQLVKSDGNRFFIFAVTAGKALRAAFSMQILVAQLASWIGAVCPELGPLSSPASLKAGIHDGGVLLIEGDCFGDPVNVASKLGEDIGKFGEIMVSKSSALNENDEEMKALRASCKMESRQTEISGTTLDYFLTEAQNLDTVVVPIALPSAADVEAHVKEGGDHSAMETRELVILTTDMSGFTKLTKKVWHLALFEAGHEGPVHHASSHGKSRWLESQV